MMEWKIRKSEYKIYDRSESAAHKTAYLSVHLYKSRFQNTESVRNRTYFIFFIKTVNTFIHESADKSRAFFLVLILYGSRRTNVRAVESAFSRK